MNKKLIMTKDLNLSSDIIDILINAGYEYTFDICYNIATGELFKLENINSEKITVIVTELQELGVFYSIDKSFIDYMENNNVPDFLNVSDRNKKIYYQHCRGRKNISIAKEFDLTSNMILTIIKTVKRKIEKYIKLIENDVNKVCIGSLDISAKIYNALKRNNIHFISEIIDNLESGEIWEFRDLGKKSILEIAEEVDKIKGTNCTDLVNKQLRGEKVMVVDGKEYITEKRSLAENNEFIELLQSAEEKLARSLKQITYDNFPEINKKTILKVKNIIGEISRVKYNIVNNGCIYTLFKLVEVSNINYIRYYKLEYFKGRKDTGSIFIATDIDIADCIDDDEFLNVLVKRNKLQQHQAEFITEIIEIDEEEYDKKCEK